MNTTEKESATEIVKKILHIVEGENTEIGINSVISSLITIFLSNEIPVEIVKSTLDRMMLVILKSNIENLVKQANSLSEGICNCESLSIDTNPNDKILLN